MILGLTDWEVVRSYIYAFLIIGIVLIIRDWVISKLK